MTAKQYDELMEKPIEEVKELAEKAITEMGYGEDLQEIGLLNTVDKINEEIKEENKTNQSKRVKKVDTGE